MKLTRYHVRRTAYEAERAFLMGCGRGGLPTWEALPDAIRMSDKAVHPAGFHSNPEEGPYFDQVQNELRRKLYEGVMLLLGPEVDPLSS